MRETLIIFLVYLTAFVVVHFVYLRPLQNKVASLESSVADL